VSRLTDMLNTPLGVLLGGVTPEVFSKKPRQVSTRELSRSMPEVLGSLRNDRQYVVLTNRGAPSFLIVPIDPQSWTSLLVATAPQLEDAHDHTAWENEVVSTSTF
jgi:antitoxin (DNA-binding transcriptional repressor) of toxin-antitoxin stability system